MTNLFSRRSLSPVGLNNLCKLARWHLKLGLVSLCPIWPCPPGPTQACWEPRLVNLLSALEYLSPPPTPAPVSMYPHPPLSMPVPLGPIGQYDSLPNPFRQECQPCAPWACPIEGMSCQYPFPPPFGSINKLGRGFKEARLLLQQLHALGALEA